MKHPHVGETHCLMDIRVVGDLFVIAAAKAGILLCCASGGKLECISRCETNGKTCAQTVPSENGRFIIAHCGDQHMAVIDISDVKTPKVVLWDKYEPGLLYYRQLTYSGVDGRYYGCFRQGNLTHWYDLGGETPELMSDWNNGGNNFFNGVTGTNMPHTALGVSAGGDVVIVDVGDKAKPKLLRAVHFSGHPDIGCFTDNGIIVPLGHLGIALVSYKK